MVSLRLAYIICLIVGLITTVIFVGVYAFIAPWYKSRIGIHLMSYTFNTALIYIAVILSNTRVGSMEFRQSLYLGVSITTAFVAGWRTYELIRVHVKEKRALRRARRQK